MTTINADDDPREHSQTGRWPSRSAVDPEDRRRVMEDVGIIPSPGRQADYAFMLALSVVISVMGLSTNSPAIVIGAMLLAPLMTPVLGVAAALAMALFRPLGRSALIVLVSVVATVGLATVLSLFLPNGELTNEIMARTSPDLRDLVVALAAGAAGAYATVRPGVSSKLPGVAVAVALVPPLADLGILIEARRFDLASGAGLLFLANLAGILLLATAVFVGTGFVPRGVWRYPDPRVIAGGTIVAALTMAISIPLASASVNAAKTAHRRQIVTNAADRWVDGTGNSVDGVVVDTRGIAISVSGPQPPPDRAILEQALGAAGVDTDDFTVRWTQRYSSNARDAVPPANEPGSAAERRVAALAREWLSETSSGSIGGVEIAGDVITIEVISPNAPPAINDLAARLDDDLAGDEIVVQWTRRSVLTEETANREAIRATVEQAARRWASEHSHRVRVDEVTSTDSEVAVYLWVDQSTDIEPLRKELTELLITSDRPGADGPSSDTPTPPELNIFSTAMRSAG